MELLNAAKPTKSHPINAVKASDYRSIKAVVDGFVQALGQRLA